MSRWSSQWNRPLQYSVHRFRTAVLSDRMFPVLYPMTADLCCWVLVRALRVLWASLLFPDSILFSMFLHCSSVHSYFAVLIFFLTSSMFLYSRPGSVLVHSCCLECRLLSHGFRTSFVTQYCIVFLSVPRTFSAVESSTSFDIAVNAVGCKLSTYRSLEHFHYFRIFEVFQVKSDARALLEALGFQL